MNLGDNQAEFSEIFKHTKFVFCTCKNICHRRETIVYFLAVMLLNKRSYFHPYPFNFLIYLAEPSNVTLLEDYDKYKK